MRRALLAGIALALVAAAPAPAATTAGLTPDGQFLDVTGGAEANRVLAKVTVDDGGAQVIELIADDALVAGSGCVNTDRGVTVCRDPVQQVRVALGGGDDTFQPTEIATARTFGEGALVVDLGEGNDTYTAHDTNALAVVRGGPGNDTLEGSINADRLSGDDGDDKLDGDKGADDLRGGPGTDLLEGDLPSSHGIYADVLDGGEGTDTVDDYRFSGDPTAAPPISVTLDGAANDGRQGENDNVIAVERIKSGSAGSFTGDDADNTFEAPQVGPPGTLAGNGGRDTLIAGDAHGDVVDGGAGDDLVEGGFGDDRLVGGPGRDTVNGDRKSRCNEYACDLFVAGNDVIEVRDGEVDSVSCGTGADRVVADAADVIADACETIERAAAGGQAPPETGGQGGDGGDAPRARLSLGRTKLARALRAGLKVTVTGASGTVKLRALRGRKVVASGSARASGSGRAVVTLRFTRAARRSLARVRRVTLKLTGAGTAKTVVLRR